MTLTNIANTRLEKLLSIGDEWSNENLDNTFDEYLKNNLYNPEKAIKVLANCKCCDRHQIKKPLLLEKYINSEISGRVCQPVSESVSEPEPELECQCKCRHLSRFICRTFV